MGILEKITDFGCKHMPAKFFNPKAGDKTLKGFTLHENPSLEEIDEVKYAVFTDPRFYQAHLYEKLIPFLPKEFVVLDGPKPQNCFMHCLDIDPKVKNFGVTDFDRTLGERGYDYLDFSEEAIQEGDILVYSVSLMVTSARRHAAIWNGNGKVISRFGKNSPLIEHPYREVTPNYWAFDDDYLTIERKVE